MLTAQKLTDITRGMQHAASTTSAMVAQQYILMVEQFFDSLDDGSIRAKMAKVYVDDNHYMLMPLVSLVSPKGITLDKLRVELSLQMSEAEVKDATSEMDNSLAQRTSFSVSLSPKGKGESRRRSDVVDIVMEFKATDPPEGIMRLIEQYTNRITPTQCKEGEEPVPPETHMKIKIPKATPGEDSKAEEKV